MAEETARAEKADAAQVRRDELKFRYELAALRFEIKLLKASLQARRHAKANFNPDQPRVPAGHPDGGQWTDDDGWPADASGLSTGQIYAAGLIPRIPRQRPPSAPERTALMRAVAIWLAEKGFESIDFIARSSWLYQAIPTISSYLDAPRSLGELQSDLSSKSGYDVHHVVERASALADRYPRSLIERSDNLVRIPRMKHWEINGWYGRPNPDFGDVSPREYLIGKDWDERRRVGLLALKKYGVLK